MTRELERDFQSFNLELTTKENLVHMIKVVSGTYALNKLEFENRNMFARTEGKKEMSEIHGKSVDKEMTLHYAEAMVALI